MRRIKYVICALWLLAPIISVAQYSSYQFVRPITGVSDTWHSIDLPDELYGKVSTSLRDIRIIQVNGSDTLEVPYFIKKPKSNQEEINFEVINQTKDAGGYYYTFKLTEAKSVDQIRLQFSANNFDVKLKLEGSQDQKAWFEILDNYRILSIQNELTDYQFTSLKFPKTEYSYYRLYVAHPEDLGFISAGISRKLVSDVRYRNYETINFTAEDNKTTKQTLVTADFEVAVPVSFVTIDVADSLDFYRGIDIQYLKDSFETEKGWRYNYQSLFTGTLSSLEENTFRCSGTVVRRLRVEVSNNDNQPLHIRGVSAKGVVKTLIARFNNDTGSYYLLYGNREARKAKYDLKNFASSVPGELVTLTLGNETATEKVEEEVGALFENQWWFWAIIVLVIALLGFFSVKLLKGE